MESVETLSFDSAIAVHGRTLVLTPDLGAALDLDRFDGQLNWERTVTMDAEVVGDQKVSVYQKRFQGQPFIAGGVAIVAPLANSQVQALSLETGAAIWHLSDLGDATLIGGIEANAAAGPTTKPANSAAPSIAILSGAAVAGLDINTGQAVWGWQPSPGSSISGPAVVNGSLVHVPVEGKIITLSAVTGTSASPGGAVPTMAPALKNGSALSALTQAGVVSSFDRSAAPGN
jgi:outer membrane protein assembly factor BamB